MNPDRESNHLTDLSKAIEQSLQADCPPVWHPAFAAADDKGVKEGLMDQLKNSDSDGTAVADAGGVQLGTNGGPPNQVASANGSNGFADLLRGWLGRATA
jgi:hypothetical protein